MNGLLIEGTWLCEYILGVLDFTVLPSPPFPYNEMPTPKFFKSSSKSNAPESGSVVDVSADDKEGISNSTNVTPGDAVPAYSDGFKEVWAAAHRDVPQAQGAEKVLNKIGGSTVIPARTFCSMLTLSEKWTLRML